MKGLLIFAGGVLTGAAATFGVLTVIAKKRQSKEEAEADDISRDGWEEFVPKVVEEPKEETPDPANIVIEENPKMNENINVDISNEHNDLINKYATEHREVPERFLEPIIFDKEDFDLSPYDRVSYTYLQKDDVLLDENGSMVVDGRCGDEFADICIRDGVAYVCNEELEMLFEIDLDTENTYEDMQIEDEWYDD